MLIVETSLAFGREVLRGVGQYVVTHQPWSLYVDLRELMVEPPEWLEGWNGDGLISRSTTPELATRLRQIGLPTVDLTDMHGDLGLPHIWVDHAAAGAAAARHLLERGFRHFGYCGYSNHDWSAKRRDGFLVELGAQLPASDCCGVYESPWDTNRSQTWEERQQAIAAWLRELPKPVGVMACNDMRGQHVLDACRRVDLPVPEDVAVIGVDNDELICQLCAPPLSSVVLNAHRIGYEAAQLLDELMTAPPRGSTAGQPPGERRRLIEPLGVATRQSTDVLAIDNREVKAALRYIREHACEGLTVESVLAETALSRSVLERLFRKHLGHSPQTEIRTAQLKRVKQLLAETDLTLEQIAPLTGYKHAEYLSVVFKRESGETPGQYRQRTRSR